MDEILNDQRLRLLLSTDSQKNDTNLSNFEKVISRIRSF